MTGMGSADWPSSAMIDLMVIPPAELVGWSRVAAGIDAPRRPACFCRLHEQVYANKGLMAIGKIDTRSYRGSLGVVRLTRRAPLNRKSAATSCGLVRQSPVGF